MERYKRLVLRRTGLKAAFTRQINNLTEYLKQEHLNETVFEEKRAVLRQTLKNLRDNSESVQKEILEISDTEYEKAVNDLEQNEIDLEEKEEAAAKLKCEFDSLLARSKNQKPIVEATPKVTKPKFKPKDLTIPRWDGDLINFNAWRLRLEEYFKLTGLEKDREQLVILLYENVMPAQVQSTLQDCVTVNDQNGVWDRLILKFPPSRIPKAILQALKETKPMSGGSAREMRRVLEKLKDYSRHAKESKCENDLKCNATIDLVEQKLTDNLVRSFRKWLHREHRDENATVDLLITFLQTET